MILFCFNATAFAAATDDPPEGMFSLKTIEKECIEFSRIEIGFPQGDASDCAVSDFGLIGSIEGNKYYYAIYCLIPTFRGDNFKCEDAQVSSYQSSALAIFVLEKGGKFLKLWLEKAESNFDSLKYVEPAIIRNRYGAFLAVPIHNKGTDDSNASEYYIWNESHWELVDSKSLFDELRKELPEGFRVLGGIWPDLEDMTARVGLYKEKDKRCCPSATAHMDLEFIDKKFSIRAVDIDIKEEEEIEELNETLE